MKSHDQNIKSSQGELSLKPCNFNDGCSTKAGKNGGSIPCIKLTAGDDQLPQESAKVTNGSDNSNPEILLAVNSTFFVPFVEV